MIVHLRNKETKLYYAGRRKWVTAPPPELKFFSIPEALLYSRQEGLRGMEVVLLHSDSMHKVILPIGMKAAEPEHSNYGMYRSSARV
jgi:hypothetical protein